MHGLARTRREGPYARFGSHDPLLASVPIHEGYKVLGGVVLYQELGRGGMGAVYRGKHLRLNVDVAVKVMATPPGLPASEEEPYVKRFIREARAFSEINTLSPEAGSPDRAVADHLTPFAGIG